MPRQNYSSKRVLNFGGPSKNALDAANIRYFYVEEGSTGIPYCKVRTRAGHTVAFNPASAVKSMYNFASIDPTDSSSLNWIFYYTGTEAKIYDIDTAISASMDPPVMIGSPAVKLSFAEAGTKAYFCGFDAKGLGTGSGYVVDNNGDADKLFEPPMLTTAITIVLTEPSAGSVTAGTHKLLFILTTRNGFTGRPGPIDGSGNVVPATIVSSGSKIINFAFSGTFPAAAELGSISILMSPTDDPDTYYFVGGATAGVVSGAWSGNIEVNISDAALLNSVPAIDYFSKLTRSAADVQPFAPSFVCAYKNRMVYGAGDRVYISDPFDYQSLTADRHVQYLPGLKAIVGAFPYRDGSLHLLSHDATYSLADSGGTPVEWSGPQLVDGRIGTPAPNGMTRDSSRNDAWVATPESLRLFSDGTYADPPVSSWVPAWSRINWAQAAKIEIQEDIDEHTVMVLAPLDEATDPSHLLVFDYQAGRTPDRIRFTLNDAPGRFCMARVVNPDTGKNEFWFGPQASGKVWKQDKETTLDEDTAITGQVYETARLLDASEVAGLTSFHGLRMTVSGTAALTVVPYSEEHTKSINDPKVIMLSQLTAGERPLRQWRMNANNQSIKFSTESGYFELTEMEVFHSPWVGQR